MLDLDRYFEAELIPAGRYAGQLSPDFQAALAQRYAVASPSECLFAQTVALRDGTVLQGGGDFRGIEAALLGGCAVEGRRVLEFGPGSGSMTSYLAAHGAEIVSLEHPVGTEMLTSPATGLAQPAELETLRGIAERMRRAWWLVKQRDGFDATMVYCDLEALPDDLGRFDISLFAASLLRLPNPYMALGAAAARTDGTIIVTEPVTALMQHADTSLPLAAFAPDLGASDAGHWWNHSPAAIARMLLTLGFSRMETSVHTAPHAPVSFFTIAAHRVA